MYVLHVVLCWKVFTSHEIAFVANGCVDFILSPGISQSILAALARKRVSTYAALCALVYVDFVLNSELTMVPTFGGLLLAFPSRRSCWETRAVECL